MIVLWARAGKGAMATGSAKSSREAAKSAEASPTLRRWELAARLRELRIAAGKSVDEVATELMCSAAKISRMETAGRGVQPRDIRDLVRFYGLPDSVQVELMGLAEQAKRPGWWQSYRTLADQTAHLIGLEQSARDVRTVDVLTVPGLLQTEAYTTSWLESVRLPGELPDGLRKDWVDVRMRRQKVLADPGFRLSAIVDEAALARSVGSADIMIDQLRHLLSMAGRPSIVLQVVPFSRGAHPGLDGFFQWMRFAEGQIGDVVFTEGLHGLGITDKKEDVARYRSMHDHIASSVALDRQETKAWLRKHIERFERGIT